MTNSFRLLPLAAALLLVAGSATLPVHAQTRAEGLSPEEFKQKVAELQRPRTAVPFDPKQFDKYAGFYQPEAEAPYSPYMFISFTRKGEHFYAAWGDHLASQATKESDLEEIFPEGPAVFFSTADKTTDTLSDLFTFVTDSRGRPGIVSAGAGVAWHAHKVDEAVVKAAEAALAARIKAQTASPGTEGALRSYIASLQNKEPNYDNLTPTVATLARNLIQANPGKDVCGVLESLTFTGVNEDGNDEYEAVFDHARRTLRVLPLTPDDKYGGPALPC